MADTVKQVNELRVKCTLRQGTAQTTRTLSVSNPKPYDAEQIERMKAFRDKLLTGSLSGVVQPASWRDDGDMEPFETAAVEFSSFTSTEVFHDLDEELEPLNVTFSPASYSDGQFVMGESTATVNVEGEGNFEITDYEIWGANTDQSVTISGLTIKIDNDPQSPPSISVTEGESLPAAVVTVADVVTGRTGTATLSNVSWTPRVKLT